MRVEGQETRTALLNTSVGGEGEDGDIGRRKLVGRERQNRERGIRRIREDEVIVGRITAADGFRQGPGTVGVQPAGAINREERSQDLVGVRRRGGVGQNIPTVNEVRIEGRRSAPDSGGVVEGEEADTDRTSAREGRGGIEGQRVTLEGRRRIRSFKI